MYSESEHLNDCKMTMSDIAIRQCHRRSFESPFFPTEHAIEIREAYCTEGSGWQWRYVAYSYPYEETFSGDEIRSRMSRLPRNHRKLLMKKMRTARKRHRAYVKNHTSSNANEDIVMAVAGMVFASFIVTVVILVIAGLHTLLTNNF